jgi:cytochrome bd-type quinol oxidase subunit 2
MAALKNMIARLNISRTDTPELMSYIDIRRTIGWLGILLPFVLLPGAMALGSSDGPQPSISHYYYTNMREIFVGTLCAVSLFLFTYRGYSRMDNIASNLAGLFGLGVALFPTDLISGYPGQAALTCLTPDFEQHATVHFICAGLFFLTLALMSLFLFTRSRYTRERQTPQKRRRNVVYVVCGLVMIACIAWLAIYLNTHEDDQTPTVFVLETVSLLAFGLSWLTKGEALYPDNREPLTGIHF